MVSTNSRYLLWEKNAPSQEGFTLMELLLAITIFAVVISLALGAYSTTFSVIANGDVQAKYGARARVVVERFSNDLQSLHAGSAGFIKGEADYKGSSRADNLSFSSTAHLVLDRQALPVGYAVITYSIDEDDETGLLRLYRADVPFRPGTTAEEDKGLILCDGLREVMYTYYSDDGIDSDSWDSASTAGNSSRFPVMVKLKLGFASEEEEDQTIYYSTAVAMAR